MFEPDKDGVIARIDASPIRRMFAVVMLIVLGALLVYVAFTSQAGFVSRIVLLAFGVVALIYADMLRRATQAAILLTSDGLVTTDGVQLAPIDDIASVQRGAFAFKPSHGFTLVMKSKQPRGWAPGMWWRFGTRVGIGGVTPAGPAKFVAENIALRIAK